MEIQFEKVYKGKVTSVRQETVTSTGYRQYEIWFKNKKLYYQIHQKKSMNIAVGTTVRFTARNVNNMFWVIKDVLDVYTEDRLRHLYYVEEEKQRIITEETHNYIY
jgi:hypothetical protein